MGWTPNIRDLLLPALLLGVLAGAPTLSAALRDEDDAEIVLLQVQPGQSMADWLQASGFAPRRPLGTALARFRIEQDALRLETAGDQGILGRTLNGAEAAPLADYPYLRMDLRVAQVPQGARLVGEARDDSAFRLIVVFREQPIQALVYVWTWEEPVGSFTPRGRHLLADLRGLRRKAIGQGPPPPDWLRVEVNLLADYRAQFGTPAAEPPPPLAIAIRADSDNSPGQGSLAWLRRVSRHPTSLAADGGTEGARLPGANGAAPLLWFR